MAVRIGATDEDAVFLDDAEAGGRFAGSREESVPAVGAEDGEEGGCSARLLERSFFS